jgi:putative endonuclease
MGEVISSGREDSGRDSSGRTASRRTGSGRIGEDVAALFLQLKGYRIIGRNVRTRASELDIVAEKSGCVVFAEVKLRGPGRLSQPVEAVDWRKRGHMVKGAAQFLHGRAPASYRTARFDVLSVSWTEEKLVVEHIEDAFAADGTAGW